LTGEVRHVCRDSAPVAEHPRPGPRTAVSDNADAVVFDSPAANLVPDDTNSAADVFLRRLN
ncbi:hypothetical protein ACFVZ2_25270, partial [Streptomyces lasiicapitis]